MKILYLDQYFVPPDGIGITRSYEYARRLIANGHEVTMITSSAMLPQTYQHIQNVRSLQIAGIPVIVIPVAYSNSMSFAQRKRAFLRFALLAAIEAVRRRADVIFATSTPLTIAIPGIVAHLWQRKPMVLEIGDLWPELPIKMGALQNPVERALALALEWAAYHSAERIIALSPEIAAGVRRTNIPEDRIALIPSSCDVELFDVPAACGDSVRESLGLRPGQPLVLYAGTFGMINGVEYLVDIAAAMRSINRDVRFLLVGRGKERDHVIRRAQETGVLDHTLWVWEPVPKAQIPAIFAAATVSTVIFRPLEAIWRTNSANKFFDGLAAGKPVIINDLHGWQAQMLRETGAGLAMPGDNAAAAAHQLAAYLADAERLREASAAARNLAYQRFHRDLMTAALETVLREATRRTLTKES